MSDRVLAVVGATGAVGRTMVDILQERDFPLGSLRLVASPRSKGSVVATRWGEVTVESLEEFDPSGVDLALFSAGGERARQFAPVFAAAGAVVIDNSSAFRMEDDVPLVVASVNDEALAGHHGIIANPNCSTMTLVMAVAPLHRAAGLVSMVATTYQSVSGSGQKAVAELERQTHALLGDTEALVTGGWSDPGSEVFVRPIAFNVLPFAGAEGAEGYTDEEWKLVYESRKILDAPDIAVEPTCVRVPVMTGHGVAASAWFRRPMPVSEAAALIEGAPGVELWTDYVPTPLDSAGRDDVLVGRLRATAGKPGGINLWTVSDNLRKGAALNAIQIAELLVS